LALAEPSEAEKLLSPFFCLAIFSRRAWSFCALGPRPPTFTPVGFWGMKSLIDEIFSWVGSFGEVLKSRYCFPSRNHTRYSSGEDNEIDAMTVDQSNGIVQVLAVCIESRYTDDEINESGYDRNCWPSPINGN